MRKPLLLVLLGLVTICRVSFGETNQSSQQLITYQCFLISSDNPIPHDFSQIKNYCGYDILRTPEVLNHIGRETRIEVTRNINPEYINTQKAQSSIPLGVAFTLTGTLNQDKIILTGKMVSTEAGTAKTSSDSTSLETHSSTLYFSKITESGHEVWFDVDRLFLKGGALKMGEHQYRYHALRIIPTLVPAKQ